MAFSVGTSFGDSLWQGRLCPLRHGRLPVWQLTRMRSTGKWAQTVLQLFNYFQRACKTREYAELRHREKHSSHPLALQLTAANAHSLAARPGCDCHWWYMYSTPFSAIPGSLLECAPWLGPNWLLIHGCHIAVQCRWPAEDSFLLACSIASSRAQESSSPWTDDRLARWTNSIGAQCHYNRLPSLWVIQL